MLEGNNYWWVFQDIWCSPPLRLNFWCMSWRGNDSMIYWWTLWRQLDLLEVPDDVSPFTQNASSALADWRGVRLSMSNCDTEMRGWSTTPLICYSQCSPEVSPWAAAQPDPWWPSGSTTHGTTTSDRQSWWEVERLESTVTWKDVYRHFFLSEVPIRTSAELRRLQWLTSPQH